MFLSRFWIVWSGAKSAAVFWKTKIAVDGEHLAPKMRPVYWNCCLLWLVGLEKSHWRLFFLNYTYMHKHRLHIGTDCNWIFSETKQETKQIVDQVWACQNVTVQRVPFENRCSLWNPTYFSRLVRVGDWMIW